MSGGWALLPAFALVLACAAGGGGAEAPPEGAGSGADAGAAADIPAAVASLKIPNARMPAPGLLTGGQPSREQIASLRDQGFRAFISLRPADESGAGWEEEFAESAGVEFHRIPIAGPADLTRENAGRLAALLEDAAGAPAALYCGSGNRVGALLALKAHLVDGESAGDALAFGKAAGLTRLEPAVREILGAGAE